MKKMKFLILFVRTFLSILTFLFALEVEAQAVYSQCGKFYPEVKQRSVIIGHIVNMDEFSEAPKSIKLEVDNITIDYPHMFETEIGKKGDFKFDIPLYHSMNAYLYYGDGRITPYIFPNDTLKMKCELRKDGFKFSIANVRFDSQHDKFQKDFVKLHDWLYNNQLSNFHDNLSIGLTPEQLKTQLLDFEKVLLDSIDCNTKKFTLNRTLADYLRFSASYSLYQRIVRESKKIEGLKEKQQFLSFLDDSVVFNPNAMLTSAYNTFLNSYNFDLASREGFPVVTSGKTEEQVLWEMMSVSVDNDFKRRNGIWAEYLASTFVFNSLCKEGLSQSEISLYSKLVNEKLRDNYIRQLLLSMCSQLSHKIAGDENLLTPSDAMLCKYESESWQEIFGRILEDNKGKVIYIDVWATWCSPCIKLFDHSSRMHETLKNKDVALVYLCCRSNEVNWRNVVKKHQVVGTHVLLSQKQYEEFRDEFSIRALPQFILVDSDGKVVDNHAPKPDSEEILIEINKLLKHK